MSLDRQSGYKTLLVVIIGLVALLTLGGLATATNHEETVEFNTTEEQSETVRFGDKIQFSGEGIDLSQEYLLEDRGGNSTDSFRDVLYDGDALLIDDIFFNSEGVLELDTGALYQRFLDDNRSVTGDYALRSLTEGTVSIQNQSPTSPQETVRIYRSNGLLTDVQTPSTNPVEFSSDVSTFAPVDNTEWSIRPLEETTNKSKVLVDSDNNTGNLDGFYELTQSNVLVDSVQANLDARYDVVDTNSDGISSEGEVRLNERVAGPLEFTYVHQITNRTETDLVVDSEDGVLGSETLSYESVGLSENRPREVIDIQHIENFKLVATYQYAESLGVNSETVEPTEVDAQNRYELENSNVIVETLTVNSNDLEGQVVNATNGVIEFNDTVNNNVDVSYEYATSTEVTTEEVVGFDGNASSGDVFNLEQDSVIMGTLNLVEQNPRGQSTNLNATLTDSNSGVLELNENQTPPQEVDVDNQAVVEFEDGQISVSGSGNPSVETGEEVTIEYTFNRQDSDVVVSDGELGFSGFYNVGDVGSGIVEVQNPTDGISVVSPSDGTIRLQDQEQAGLTPTSAFVLDYTLDVPETNFEGTQTVTHDFEYDVPYEVELQVTDAENRVLSDRLQVPADTQPSNSTVSDDSVVIETASANVDYVVGVYTVDTVGQTLIGTSGVFDETERVENLEIDNLEENIFSENSSSVSLEEGDRVGVVLHDARSLTGEIEDLSEDYNNLSDLAEDLPPLFNEEAGFGDIDATPVEDTANLGYDQPPVQNDVNPVKESVRDPVSEFPFTLISEYANGEYNENNRLVFSGELNLGDNSSKPTSIPLGSEILLSGDYEGDTVEISRQSSNSTLLQLPVNDSVETLDKNQIVIDTDSERLPDGASGTGDFEVETTDGRLLFNFTVVEQNLDTTLNPSDVNINSKDADSRLNVSSNLLGFDILVNETSLNTSEMIELFNNTNRVSPAFPSMGQDSPVQVQDINSVNERIQMNFGSIEEGGVYEFETQVVGGVLATDSFTLNATSGPLPDATLTNFGPGERDERDGYQFSQGDRMRVGVDLDAISEVNVSLSGPDAEFRFTAELNPFNTEYGNKFDILFETYTFDGEDAFGNDRNLRDVLSLRGAVITNTSGDLPEISEFLQTGEYFIEVRQRDNGTLIEEDVASIDLVEPETNSIDTWVMPQGSTANISGLSESGTPQENVALGDTMVVEIDATGFDSKELITNSTHPSALVNYERRVDMDPTVDSVSELMNEDEFVERVPEISVNIEGEKPRNRPSVHILPEEASGLSTQVGETVQNRIFLFFDLTDSDVFENFDPDISYKNTSGVSDDPIDFVEQRRDHVTNYDIELNYTEDYKYVTEEDNRLDEEGGMELHERMIGSELARTTVQEEDEDTRFVVETANNSSIVGSTFIAPETEVDVVLRDDREENPQDESFRFEETTVVEESSSLRNTVGVEANLSSIEPDRRMTLDFNPVNEFSYPVISQGQEVPPEIEDVEAEFDTERPISSENIRFSAVVENVAPSDIEYNWSFGDGSSVSGARSPVHVYDESGLYNVTLQVQDRDSGLTDNETFQITISEEVRTAPEIVELNVPETATVGEELTMTVVAEDEQVESGNLRYEWSFREGEGFTANGITVTNTYNVSGPAQVTVTVTDPEDETLSTQAQQVIEVNQTIDNPPLQNNSTDNQNATVTLQVEDSRENQSVSQAQVQLVNISSNETVDQFVLQGDSDVDVELQSGEYEVTATAEGYNTLSRQLNLSGGNNTTVSLDMSETVETTNGSDNGSSENNSSGGGGGSPIPTIGLIIVVVGLVIVGAYVYYRRQIQAQSIEFDSQTTD